jgi:hypothetical protein
MEKLIRDIIFGIIYMAGGLIGWALKGFRTSLKEELFSETNKNRNGFFCFCLFAALVALVIYLNNRGN